MPHVAMRGSTFLTSCLVWIVVFAGCALSRNTQVMDSHYTLFTAETLLKHGDVYLERYIKAPLDKNIWPGTIGDGLPYQMIESKGHIIYGYLVGSSVLSMPFVAAANALGWSTVSSIGQYNGAVETPLQRYIAAILVAFIAVTLFLVARVKLSGSLAFCITLIFVFGSPIWSTLAMGLWSQVWVVMLIAPLVAHLYVTGAKNRPPSPALIAAISVLLVFVRYPAAISVVATGVYLLLRHRRVILPAACWGLLFLVLLGGFNWWEFGQLSEPTIYSVIPERWDWHAPLTHVAGVLISPGRGLFIYMPLSAIALLAPLFVWRKLDNTALACAAYTAIMLHLAMLSVYGMWWGGFSFGPRLCAEMLPWLFVLGVMSLQVWQSGPRWSRPWKATAFLGLAVMISWSLYVNYRGANIPATIEWNARRNIDYHPEALWDWRDLPVFAH